MTSLETANPHSFGSDSDADDRSYRRLLIKIILLNAVMFLVELLAGLWSGSTALLADSLDMFGDALTYGISFWVLTQSNRSKYRVALFKSLLMLLLGTFVIYEAIDKVINPVLPEVSIVFWVSILALMANSLTLFWLTQHRQNDINRRSVMACSYTDVVASAGVLLSALLVWWSGYHWPDLFVGLVVAFLFLRAAYGIFIECWQVNKETSHLPELVWLDQKLSSIKRCCHHSISPHHEKVRRVIRPQRAVNFFHSMTAFIKQPFMAFLGLSEQKRRIQQLEQEVSELKNKLSELTDRNDQDRNVA